MYEPPASFNRLVKDLTNDAWSRADAKLAAHIELTLQLVDALGLDAEPITIGWVLLSRMPLYDSRLERLTPEQRRMWANASVIVPYRARYGWENAVTRYAKLPRADLKLYRINPEARLEDQMIDVCRQAPCPDPMRTQRYDELLKAFLPFEKRKRRYTQAGNRYKVRVKDADGKPQTGIVTITEAMQQMMPANRRWFENAYPRTVLTITLEELMSTAAFLDDYERKHGEGVHWVHDLKQIRFRKVTIIDGKIRLEEQYNLPLAIQGEVHLPGLVSAGKTTLAKLIIAHVIRHCIDMRIALVVGDSSTAIEIADQVNSWFLNDPAGDEVCAIPLLGKSQREIHLGRLLASRHYAHSIKCGRPHWGERWLMPVCPLASKIEWDVPGNVQIPAGGEPCEGLINTEKRPEWYVCPLHSVCPSKQLYRDMPQARLWVTTPGALSQASLPLYFDNRVFTMGDLIYEQCDLVILDEVETIVDWYDRTFAKKEDLTNGKNGLLDRLDTQISQYWNANRVLPANERRWIVTARDSLKALSSILTSLADPKQKRVAKEWVKKHHFAPHQLAFRLSRRLAGLKEWDDKDTPIEVRHQNERLMLDVFQPFDDLLNGMRDPLRLDAETARRISSEAAELARIMQDMNNLPEDMADSDLIQRCRRWIDLYQPDMQAKLDNLRETLSKSDNPFDHKYLKEQLDRSIDELARRLYFMLTVTLLDRHLHLVFTEWHNKPEELDAQQPFSQIPRGAKAILPLPLTGQQYGFVADTTSPSKNQDARNQLALYTHTNIGRAYLLNFHRLREDFEDKPGPHVLALSGTSYLPDSTPFHVDLPLGGVLMPPENTEQAIKASRFIWQYFTDTKTGKPIQVSGRQDKERQLRLLMNAMLEYGGLPGGFIAHVLQWLETQGKDNPAQWADRVRVLLLTNSYTQAKKAAQTLRDGWRSEADRIFHLRRGSQGEDFEIERGKELKRMDIEQFATHTDGRILVAPMQAIGRGFNILNNLDERKAAFGAVFFLTRPMNMPNDMQTTAQELNRFALEWAKDPTFSAWQEDTLYKRGLRARERSVDLRRSIEQRWSYTALDDDAILRTSPRRDLASTTAGKIVQAVGRLLRGGVPFRAYLVDAAWSPNWAESGDKDSVEKAETSLLTALIEVLDDYALQDEVGNLLYGGLSEALNTTEGRNSN